MKIIDSGNYISSMKADKYKDIVFRFCEILEKKYDAKATLKYSLSDSLECFKLSFRWPDQNDYDCVEAYVEVRSRKLPPERGWTKTHPATYRRLFNSLFMKDNNGFYFYHINNGKTYTTPVYKTLIELMIALDIDSITLTQKY
jgi:hypothetical protein